MRSTVVQVLGDGDEADVVVRQDLEGLQGDAEIPGPSVQGMDDDDIELVLARVVQELAENGPFGDGLDVSGLAFLTIDPNGLPLPVLAQLVEELILGV